MAGSSGGVQRIWESPNRFFRARLPTNTVTVLDHRGFGLSDRDVERFTVEDLEADITAVAEAVGAARFEIVSMLMEMKIAIGYAAHHPERVNFLTLVNPVRPGPGLPDTVTNRLLNEMLHSDWDLFTQNAAGAWAGWTGASRERLVEDIRAYSSPAAERHFQAFLKEYDVRPLLPDVRCRALVVFIEGTKLSTVDDARHLAAELPRAGFQSVGDVSAVDQISPPAPSQEQGPRARSRGSTATILFLDVVDSTPLAARLGDAAFRAQSRQLDSALREAILAAGGKPVEGKVLGDGVMAVFSSAASGIQAALACREAAAASGLQLHLGLHAGDVIDEGDNVYGWAVNLASRVCGAAAPDEILVSETVRALARGSVDLRFEDRGPHELKGVDEAQRLFAVV
jgi:class 3 adenylate cyclase